MDLELREASWRKSSRSGQSGGACVEIALCSQIDGVRDSKNPHGPALAFPKGKLPEFLSGIKIGQFTA